MKKFKVKSFDIDGELFIAAEKITSVTEGMAAVNHTHMSAEHLVRRGFKNLLVCLADIEIFVSNEV